MAREPFTIYVMQSAHTDIGYTHPQEQIAAMYLDHYDRVLDLCRASAGRASGGALQVDLRDALAGAPLSGVASRTAGGIFALRANAGQIELTAAYLHFTDLIDADAYRQAWNGPSRFARRHDLPLRCAMHCDINGWPWAVADILADAGHPVLLQPGTYRQRHRSARQARQRPLSLDARKRGDPDRRADPHSRRRSGGKVRTGGRVLHWLGEHYLLGNVLGISSPQGFHADKTRYFTETDHLTVDDLYARARCEVPRYVDRLQADGYAARYADAEHGRLLRGQRAAR